MPVVALIKCDSYDKEKVSDSLRKGIELIGGIENLFSPDEKILLKPNILAGDKPEKGVTTNPSILAGLADLLLEQNLNLTYGDSPGFGSLKRGSESSGIKAVFDARDIEAADFSTINYVSYPEGNILKRIPLAKGVMDADALISISKMKTHGFTRITGAVKNQFGCVPGLIKGEFHVKMPDIVDFSKILHDINSFIKPRLYIMDGIVAMEGNGPRGGNTVKMNSLLFSTDPVALDMVFCKLIDLNPEFVPTLRSPSDNEQMACSYNDIELTGDSIDNLINTQFNVTRKKFERFASSRSFPVFLKNLISPKPVIDYETCKNCGKCVLQCPTDPKSVKWQDKGDFGYPVYDYKTCIRCYCCQEICPHESTTIKTPLLGKLIRR
ncbi:MAG: DUF362 domain-containing protein [Acidobacteriota bacterium]